MKLGLFRYLLPALMLLSSGPAFAWMPNFEEIISKDAIISRNEINGTRIIKFATDDDLETIKKTLSKAMNKDWVEIPDKVDLARKRKIDVPEGGKSKKPGTIGSARYSNPKHKGVHIHLVILQVPAKGKAYTALITVMKVF